MSADVPAERRADVRGRNTSAHWSRNRGHTVDTGQSWHAVPSSGHTKCPTESGQFPLHHRAQGPASFLSHTSTPRHSAPAAGSQTEHSARGQIRFGRRVQTLSHFFQLIQQLSECWPSEGLHLRWENRGHGYFWDFGLLKEITLYLKYQK